MVAPANDATPPPDAEVLTAAEAAGLMRMNVDAFYVLLAQGKIPGAGKLGGAWRVHRATLLRSLADGSLVPSYAAPRKLPRRRAR